MKIGFGALQRISKMEEFMVDTRLALLSQHSTKLWGKLLWHSLNLKTPSLSITPTSGRRLFWWGMGSEGD
jgi:hypothetical protein